MRQSHGGFKAANAGRGEFAPSALRRADAPAGLAASGSERSGVPRRLSPQQNKKRDENRLGTPGLSLRVPLSNSFGAG